MQVTVADAGIGIEPPSRRSIFEPFYRAPDVVAAQIQGAGLGLSLVQRIVEAHGGRITVRSAPGTGSEFTVHLPARLRGRPATRARRLPRDSGSLLATERCTSLVKRILLVEDEPGLVLTLTDRLRAKATRSRPRRTARAASSARPARRSISSCST